MSVKGDWKRQCQTSREEENIRWLLALGKITFETYKRKRLKLIKEGKITRVRK